MLRKITDEIRRTFSNIDEWKNQSIQNTTIYHVMLWTAFAICPTFACIWLGYKTGRFIIDNL